MLVPILGRLSAASVLQARGHPEARGGIGGLLKGAVTPGFMAAKLLTALAGWTCFVAVLNCLARRFPREGVCRPNLHAKVRAGLISMGRMVVIVSRGLDGDDVVGDVLLFLLIGGVVLLVLALFLPLYLNARCIAESGEVVVTKAEEVYRLEVYDGIEKKVVYVSRNDWERAGATGASSSQDQGAAVPAD